MLELLLWIAPALVLSGTGAWLVIRGTLGLVQELRHRHRDMDLLVLQLLRDSGPMFPVEFVHGDVPRWGLRERLYRLHDAGLITAQRTALAAEPLFRLTIAGQRRARGSR